MGKKFFPIIFLGLMLVLAACGGNESESEQSTEDKGEINIGLNNWAENVAVSNMWKVVLEEEGYTVHLTQVEKGALYTALENDDLDLGLEVWLPYTDEVFYEQYKEDLAWHKTWFSGTELGLAVPTYMENIETMEDLKANADQFDGKIVGIDAGASLMGLTEEAIGEYGLDGYELQSSSGPVMTAELGKAMEDEAPILVTLWKPHWVFAEYDVKFLEDTKKVYGEKEDISWVSRQSFEEDHPELTETLNSWQMDDESLGSLMNMIKEEEDAEAGAKKWVEENRALIDEWIKPLQ
ncbi:glycine/betaine ABC transporter [Pontibacillus litoralis JSM 072002]|uniref:Glycine/betaine ABC transporter n=2 Tax=Pontibacillus TaxID=289201 RepID=A0A0A5HQ67_9BACI|nr:glycine/betaine ABC transporter [Pontibacillus litoralis JSM 072002]